MHTRKCKQKIVEINVNKHLKNLNIPANFPSAMHTSIVLQFLFVNDPLKSFHSNEMCNLNSPEW